MAAGHVYDTRSTCRRHEPARDDRSGSSIDLIAILLSPPVYPRLTPLLSSVQDKSNYTSAKEDKQPPSTALCKRYKTQNVSVPSYPVLLRPPSQGRPTDHRSKTTFDAFSVFVLRRGTGVEIAPTKRKRNRIYAMRSFFLLGGVVATAGALDKRQRPGRA